MNHLETDPLDADRLREALAPERPDPEAFLAGVRERVAQAEAAAAEDRRLTLSRLPQRWRWAASILPPGVVPFVAGSGVKLSWKAIPGLAVLPGLAGVMVLASFVGGVRHLRRLDTDARPTRRAEEAEVAKTWWKEHGKLGVLGVLFLIALVLLGSPSAGLFGVLASMVMLVLLAGRLARAGMANRAAVGRLCQGVLYVNALCWWTGHDLFPYPATGPRGMETTLVIIYGMIVCGWAAGRLSLQRIREWVLFPIRMRHPDRITVWCLRCLSFPAATIAGMGLLGGVLYLPATFLRPAGPLGTERRASAIESLVDFVENGAWVSETPYRGAEVAGGLLGLEPALADRLREAAPRHVSMVTGDPWFEATTAAVDVDWLTPGDVIGDLRERLERDLLEGNDPLVYSPARYFLSRELLEGGRATQEQVESWAARIVTAWQPDGFGALEDDLRYVRWLDAIGRGDVVDARAGELRERLVAHWRGGGGGGAAHFGPQPRENFFIERLDSAGPMYSWDIESTRAGILLMRRVGVPDGIDVDRLRGTLPAADWFWSSRLVGMRDGDDALMLLSRLELEDAFPRAQRSWWETLWELRQLLAITLLILLCVHAIRRAPAAVEADA